MPGTRSIACTTSSAPAICGMRAGFTKLTASILGRPAAARRLTSSARISGSRTVGSFWRPSRGPTSQMVMDIPLTKEDSARGRPEGLRAAGSNQVCAIRSRSRQMSSYEQRMQDTYAAAMGTGWAAYAGLLLLASGAFDVIGGIALLAKNNHLASGLFWGRPFWGVVFLIIGGVTLYAGFGVLTKLPDR